MDCALPATDSAYNPAIMSKYVCPTWVGYLLATPLRRLIHNPEKILAPFVSAGMTVLDVGPAMGFFTLLMARMVGPGGKVVCVDVQASMLRSLEKRAAAAQLSGRIVARVCAPDSLGLDDFAGRIDFALAFAVVHEIPDASIFFAGVARGLKPGAQCLVAEPKGHVSAGDSEATLAVAGQQAFNTVGRPAITRCHACLLRKAQAVSS